VPACPRRRGRHCTRSLGSNEKLVAQRLVSDSEFKHAVEHHPAATGTSAVEAEHEFVQVAGQIGGYPLSPGAAQQPPFGQGRDPVHPGQQFSRVISSGPGRPLAVRTVDLAEFVQPAVALPTVGDDRCS
jgi:hypothetical protein